MTNSTSTQKIEKVFFDLKYRYNLSGDFSSVFGDMTVDRSELSEVSAHGIYEYLQNHYKELLGDTEYKGISATILSDTIGDIFKRELFRVTYKYIYSNGTGAVDFIATNIRIIEV